MRRFYLSKLFILFALLAGWSTNSWGQSTTFLYTGGQQTYVVPAGVTSLGVDAIGGCGGYPYWQCGNTAQAYALGGRVQCTMAVTPGTTLYIYVGGQGGSPTCSSCTAQPGGFNGGVAGSSCAGGSGGATDIRLTPTSGISGTLVPPYTATNRLVVAGGGGGGADFYGNGGYGGGLTGGTGFVNSTYGGLGGNGGTQTGPGAGVGAATAAPYLGTLGVGGARYNYSGGGGGYWGGNSGTGTAGGAGGGSSYTDPTLCTSVAHTQGYTGATGNGRLILTVLCTNPGTILGVAPVCPGATITLTNPTGAGGTWVSGNPAVATIDATTGVLTGVSAGTVTVTYLETNPCGGVSATASITVLAPPAPISGSANSCIGASNTLSDAGGGTWSSSNTGIAVINSSGVVTGMGLGTATITYTLPSTCTITKSITVNPSPAAITGTTAVCAGGGTALLTDANPGGTWSSANTSIADITAGSGIVTGGTAGITTITYTLPTGCITSAVMNVNALPAPISGTPSVCVGSNTTLSDVGGGTWSSSNVSIAAVGGTGVTAGVSAGTANITYTLSSGCYVTRSVVVNPIPAAITGVTSFCNGGSTSLTSASPGGIWSSSNTAIAVVVPSSGAVTSISSGVPVITYTLPTTCFTTMPITINALPSAFSVTGGGGYCEGTGGVHIGLGLSATGVNYKLYNGPLLVATVGGSNSALDFGVYTANGTYTAVGINATTGCTSNMSGSTTVIANPLPNTFNVTGGGSFCPGGAGVHISQSGSDGGINYQLYLGGSPVGAALAGTGGALDFGAQTAPGVYTIVANNPATGCSKTMVGSATVALYALPAVHTLNAGGSYCAGGSGVALTLDGSDASTTYQLFYGTATSGAALPGAGAPINFGFRTAAGNYTVVAMNTVTGCSNNMAGTATISINPLPLVYAVTGGGSYCPGGSGAHVNLNYSSTGVNYQLYRGASPVSGALVAGSNAGLDFGLQTVAGTYTVVGIDAATGCAGNMSGSAVISINALPVPHTVTGGGAYCVGGTGVHVGLNTTNVGTRYQLLLAGVPVGTPVNGTGAAIDFGVKTDVGNYTVVATTIATSCVANMTGSVDISVNPLPAVDSVIAAGTTYCAGGTGIDIMMTASETGVNYQLYRGGAAIGSTMTGTGSSIDFGLKTLPGTYSVVATNAVTGCQIPMYGTPAVVVNPTPAVYVVNGGGSYCDGGNGVHVYLTGTTIGITYQLSNSTTGAIGLPVTGAGSSIDFGLMTAPGIYSVVAQDPITGCSSNMAGAPTVNINPLPAAFTVTGTGNYCAGSTGLHVNLSSSVAGQRYQLYSGTTPVGTPVIGLGSGIDFGAHTAGTYTVKAVIPATGCTSDMISSAVIGINPLPVAQTITGGGSYCAGGTGTDISLGGSAVGVSYQLIYAGSGISTLTGTGATLDFGMFTGAGSYTVRATDDVTLCAANMPGSAVISITPQPTAQTVTGGGAYCEGGTGVTIGLSGSNAGINYQLMSGGSAVGSLVSGTGGTLSFGTIATAGTYTVLASPGGLCETAMTGSATVSISPLPTLHTVTGGGTYCSNDSGKIINLNGSNTGINYQLYLGGSMVGSPVAGSGSALNLGLQTEPGIYTVKATNAVTGCQNTMSGSATIAVVPSPAAFNVTGGGPYCVGGNGVHVLLNGSATNVNYQLKMGGAATGGVRAGTGTVIDFGLQTTAGGYTVTGTDAGTGCATDMSDTAVVSINPIVTPVVTIATHPGLTIKMGQTDTLIATVVNGGTDGPSYQWKVNRFPIAGATNSMFISNKFANNDTVTCEATSSGMCGNVTTSKSVVLTVLNTVYVQPVVPGVADVKVSPNPSKGTFSITGNMGSNDDQEVTVEVTDVVGHVVYTEKTTASNGNINARVQLNSSVANGMYLLTLRSNAASQVFHIVVAQ